MLIRENEILAIIPSRRNFDTTRKYIQHDVVTRIEVNYIGHSDYYSVKGTTNVYGSKLDSYITIDGDGSVSDYHCSCIYCDEESACAHVGAILAKLMQLEDHSFPYVYEREDESVESWEARMERRRKQREIEQSQARLNQFLSKKRHSLKEEFASLSFDEPCELEASLSYNGYEDELSVSYRVGRESKYVIKNLSTFLNHIDAEEEIKYGKKLILTHKMDQFDEFAQKEIAFINRCYSAYLKNRYYDYYRPTLRDMPLQKQSIDDLFDLYKDSARKYRTFELSESIRKIEVKVNKEKDYYVVSLVSTENIIMGNQYIYQLEIYGQSNMHLYRYKQTKNEIAHDLVGELLKDGMLYIPHDKFDEFASYAFSNTSDSIKVVSEEEIKITTASVEVKLFGDIEESGRVFFRAECIGEDNVVHEGFDLNYENKPELLNDIEQFISDYAEEIDHKKHLAYFNLDEDRTYQFIHKVVPYLEKHCKIFISDTLKKVGKPVSYSIAVGVNLSHGLLEVDFESSEIPKEELGDVLNSYRRKKKFYRLKSGELLYLESNELDEVDQMLNHYDVKAKDMKDGTLKMNAYRAFSIDSMSEDSELLRFELSENFKEKMNQFKNIEASSFKIPKHYLNILRDYQQFGFKWFRTIAEYGFGGILADDMGLGKTVQMISVLESMKDKKHHQPNIVVCPSSILLNWSDEVEKFANNLTSICIMGSYAERAKLIKTCASYDLVITSYDYMRRDFELYQDIQFQSVILDEAQYIKNQKTKNAIAVKRLNGSHRFALTGTPIENTLAELWSIFDFLMPGYLYNYHHFTTYFEKPIVKEKDVEKEIELKKMIEPFILRRMKKEVLKELPDKIEKTISFQFNEEEKKLYFAHLAQVNEQLREQTKVDKIDSIAVLAMLTRLRQISCEPRVLFDNIDEPSSKMKGCMELILSLKETGKKVLLFSSFTSVLDLLAEELQKEKISYYMLTGSTNKIKRRELVQQFQSDDTDVFLISLKAGGTGINLTSAEAVIHFDPWWNVSAQNQATDRAYRIGQHNNVQVFKLIMKDSVEEKIMELQDVKKELSDTFVEKNKGSITQMNNDEILSLFKV